VGEEEGFQGRSMLCLIPPGITLLAVADLVHPVDTTKNNDNSSKINSHIFAKSNENSSNINSQIFAKSNKNSSKIYSQVFVAFSRQFWLLLADNSVDISLTFCKKYATLRRCCF
jgi:hypothetical protein